MKHLNRTELKSVSSGYQKFQHITEVQKKIKTIQLTSSTPMTPAPMTTNFSGTCFNDRAPVDETIVSSSIC